MNTIASIEIAYSVNGATCSLENKNFDSQVVISVYPNPTHNSLNIEVPNADSYDLVIYNLLGDITYVSNLQSGLNQVNIESLKPGVYFYSIRKEGQLIQSNKLIIE